MFHRAALVTLIDADLDVPYESSSRKRKLQSITPPPSSSTSDSRENLRTIDDFLAKKKTLPTKYCPKNRPVTQELAAPVTKTTRRPLSKIEDDDKLKNFLEERPHFRVERKLEATENEDMKVLRAFRRRDFLAAQAAKATGGFKDEPKPKKRRAVVPKPFWMKN